MNEREFLKPEFVVVLTDSLKDLTPLKNTNREV